MTTFLDRYRATLPATKVDVDEQVARLDRLNAFFHEIDRMFVPYMRLDQRTPLWWWTPMVAKIENSTLHARASRLSKKP